MSLNITRNNKLQGNQYYIGLMSGTSMDSVDAICVDLTASEPRVIGFCEQPMPSTLAHQLTQIRESDNNQTQQLARLDIEIGRLFAAVVQQLIQSCALTANDIVAIGSHGQTVLHRSNSDGDGFSLQIGDPNIIAEKTQITTVADFRRRDIAAGGEGAPLAPAFHHAYFSDANETRAIINLGGIANITYLPNSNCQHPNKRLLGFDCGPANALLDAYFQSQHENPYDENSQWAMQGKCHQALLERLLNQTDYFNLAVPKSTGKELFNMDFVHRALQHFTSIEAVDIQRTLLQFTIETIAIGLQQCPQFNLDVINENRLSKAIYCCGGGAYNTTLLELLSLKLNIPIQTTEVLGASPKQVEAIAFAWLAKRTLEGLTGNLTEVTGAQHQRILGAIYQP